MTENTLPIRVARRGASNAFRRRVRAARLFAFHGRAAAAFSRRHEVD